MQKVHLLLTDPSLSRHGAYGLRGGQMWGEGGEGLQWSRST